MFLTGWLSFLLGILPIFRMNFSRYISTVSGTLLHFGYRPFSSIHGMKTARPRDSRTDTGRAFSDRTHLLLQTCGGGLVAGRVPPSAGAARARAAAANIKISSASDMKSFPHRGNISLAGRETRTVEIARISNYMASEAWFCEFLIPATSKPIPES